MIIFPSCDHIDGVMVNVVTSGAVDRGFEHWSGQTKHYKIGICCFSTKRPSLRSKSKDWMTREKDGKDWMTREKDGKDWMTREKDGKDWMTREKDDVKRNAYTWTVVSVNYHYIYKLVEKSFTRKCPDYD